MRFIIILILLLFTTISFAETVQDSTKNSYTLFHPTPGNRMRGFETDRPDLTESAYTVDAGHFQFETDLFKTDRSTVSGIKRIQNQYNTFNLKTGLTNTLDLHFILESFVTEKTIAGNNSGFKSGIGDITVRLKQNIWGNDQGKTALAILPLINIPTGPDSKVTGGLVLAFALSLPNNWAFGSQAEIDMENNLSVKGYHINPLASATISHDIVRNLSFFTEGLISRETELKSNEYFLNTGLAYMLRENLKLDTGVYYGLRSTSSKILFLGFSWRF